MRVAFVTNQLGLRGTEVALSTYARLAAEQWNWYVCFLVRHSRAHRPANADCTDDSYAFYESQFDVVFSGDDVASDDWLAKNVDVAIVEIYGTPDAWLPKKVPSIAHCVFTAAYSLKATVHTAISESVAGAGLPGVKVLPYIADAPQPQGDLRSELGIPPDAVVFGRHGGFDTFDIPWVHEVVRQVVDMPESKAYFVFMNTRRFCTSTRVLHIEATTWGARKARFVATCDAMLHAREIGETFGLAVAEFALQRKPVFTHAVARDTEHLRLLGEQAITYSEPTQLLELLVAFAGRSSPNRTQPTGYEAYRPHNVMPLFKKLCSDATGLKEGAVALKSSQLSPRT